MRGVRVLIPLTATAWFALCALAFLPGCETRERTFVAHGQLDERRYALAYTEQVTVLPDHPGVEVWRDGHRLGQTPMVIDGAAGQVDVVEEGFYEELVTERQHYLVVFDFDWLFKHRHDEPSDPGKSASVLERMRAAEERERRAEERQNNNSEVLAPIGDVERESERDSPTRWEGRRTYTLEADRVTIELRYPDGRVEVRSWCPTAEDVAVRAALAGLVWNDELRRPEAVSVSRVLRHIPATPDDDPAMVAVP